MNKFFATAFAVGAGLAIAVAGSAGANAAGLTSTGLAAQSAKASAPLVSVHYSKRHRYGSRHRNAHRGNWRRRASYNRCGQLRRQAVRSGSRWAWSRYRAVCR